MAKFLRRYELLLGDSEKEGVKITDLHIEFSIKKTNKSETDTATFKIFNLSNETRQVLHNLEEVSSKETKGQGVLLPEELEAGLVELRVGYGNEPLTRLFVGNVVQVSSTIKAPNLITTVTCGDGYKAHTDSFLNQSFPKKTTRKQIVKAAQAKMGLTEGLLKGAALNYSYKGGYTASGYCTQVLNDVLSSARPPVNWHIKDNRLYVLPRGAEILDEAIVISEETGLIGSPERTGKSPGTPSSSTKPGKGVKFVHLLEPRLDIGTTVDMQSKHIAGQYVINKVTHTGSYEGGKWYSLVEATDKSENEEGKT